MNDKIHLNEGFSRFFFIHAAYAILADYECPALSEASSVRIAMDRSNDLKTG